ncbi:MAG: hypothetical protein VKJ24_06965, partial [Synechococcales bacterium]|nr:hypothetical protein [Synechococcales bacterium]
LSQLLPLRYVTPQETPANLSTTAPRLAGETLEKALRRQRADWLTELQTCASELHLEPCLALVTQLPPEEADLARSLQELADSYRFDLILEALGVEAIDN